MTWLGGVRHEHRGLRVVCSLGALVAMPFTPLQHMDLAWGDTNPPAMADALVAAIEAAGFEGRFAFDATDHAVSQYLAVASLRDSHAYLKAALDLGVDFVGGLRSKALTILPPPSARPGGGLDYNPPLSMFWTAAEATQCKNTYLAACAAMEKAPRDGSNQNLLEDPTASTKVELGVRGRINQDRVRVRSQPNLNGAIVGQLDKDVWLKVREYSTLVETITTWTGIWARVETDDGIQGWVFSHFIDLMVYSQ